MPTGVLLRLYIVFFWGVWLLLVLGFCFFELAAQEVHHLGTAFFGVGEAVLGSVGAAAAEEDAEGGDIVAVFEGVGAELAVGHGGEVGGWVFGV
jgi:hypothetical protein